MMDPEVWDHWRRADYYESLTGKRPIIRKHSGPCPKVACLDCFNYDPEKTVGYTCLVKGNSRTDPTEKKSCCWYVNKTQRRFIEPL